jgi:hypothetical protein
LFNKKPRVKRGFLLDNKLLLSMPCQMRQDFMPTGFPDYGYYRVCEYIKAKNPVNPACPDIAPWAAAG